MTIEQKKRKILVVEGFGHFRLESIVGISEPFPVDESGKLFGMEFYLVSGHTALLRDPHPEFLLEVRKIATCNIVSEENPGRALITLLEEAVIEIRRIQDKPTLILPH